MIDRSKQYEERNGVIFVGIMPVGKNFSQSQDTSTNIKENTMPKRMLQYFIGLVLAIMLIPASNAFALNQCGGSASTTNQLYQNWQQMGVVNQASNVAKSAGYTKADSSIKRWMNERVVIAPLYQSTTIANYGCDPGRMGSVGTKTLTKGWSVAVALPKHLSKKDIRLKRGHNTKQYKWKRKVIKTKLVAQATCSNPGKAIVKIVVWVKVKKSKPNKPGNKPCKCDSQPEPTPSISCKTGETMVNNQCVVSNTEQSAKQNCEAKGGNWNSEQDTCTVIIVNGTCSNTYVINGDGNVVNTTQGGNCNQSFTQQQCVNNGGVWNSEQNICVVKTDTPDCTETDSCPPPPPSQPAVSCVFPPHIYVNTGNQFMYCEVDKKSATLHVESDNPQVLRASSTIEVDYRWDNTPSTPSPCPVTKTCFRTTLWAGTAGFATLTAIGYSNGVASQPAVGAVEVHNEEF